MIHNVRDSGEITRPIRIPDNGGLNINEGDIIKVTRPDESVLTFVAIQHDNITEYKCARCDGRSFTEIFDRGCLADHIGFGCGKYFFKLVDKLLEDL